MDDGTAFTTAENNVLLTSLRNNTLLEFEQTTKGTHDNVFQNNYSQNPAVIAASGLKKYPGVKSTSPAGDATLSNLTVNEGIIVPDFSPNTTDYTVYVDNNVKTIYVSGTAADYSAIVSGSMDSVHLADGENHLYLTVTAPDGTAKIYNLRISRDQYQGLRQPLRGLSVYPNPAVTNVTVKSATAITRLDLYNLHGQKLLQLHPEALEADVSLASYPTGLYLLKVADESGITIEKIIKK
jgi:hypothetical protein